MKKFQSIVAGLAAGTVLLSCMDFSIVSCPVKTESPQLVKCCDATTSCCEENCACEINSTPARDAREQPAPAPVAPRTVELKLAVSVAATALAHLTQQQLHSVAARAVAVFIAPHQSLHLLDCIFLL
jgi:hypothetical protein